MSSNDSNLEKEEEDDVFLDANESTNEVNRQGQGQNLRRSSRKRKSVDSEVDSVTTPKNIGKRHHPLGNMGGVQRSPDTGKGVRGERDKERPGAARNPRTPKPTITVGTDPPTEPHTEE